MSLRLALFGMPILVLAAAIALQSGVALNHDVAWLLIAAGRLLDGGSYSADFFEMNMPLAILLYAPAQLIARASGLAIAHASLVWMFVLIAQSMLLSVRISLAAGWISKAQAPLLATWLLIGCALLPGYDFAQKEHVIAVLTLPFVLRSGAANTSLSRGLRLYVGALAAIGFFAKPHFAALPALLIAASALRARSWWSVRADLAIFAVIGMANAAFVVTAYPDWFVCAQWARDLYGAYERAGWRELLGILWLPPVTACVIATLIALLRDRALRAVTSPLLIATLYALIAYTLQFKGWSYQFLPAAIYAFAAFGLTSLHLQRSAGAPNRSTSAIAATISVVFIALTFARATTQLPRESVLRASPIAEALSPADRGDYVYAFTTTVTPVFPTVVLLDLNWSSRASALWPLAGIAQAERTNDGAQVAQYRATLVQMVVEDFARHPPQLVLVDRRSGQFGLPPNYDVLANFTADSAFARIWSRYEKIGVGAGFEIFIRNG